MDLNSLFNLLNSFQKRSIDRTSVMGLIVSTVHTPDYGPETAIVDKNAAYPVQRYQTEVEAMEGHKSWVKKVELGLDEVTMLPWLTEPAENIKLVPFEFN